MFSFNFKVILNVLGGVGMVGRGGGCAVLLIGVPGTFPGEVRLMELGYSEGPHSHRPNSHNGLPDDTNKLHCIDYVSHTGLFYTSRSW